MLGLIVAVPVSAGAESRHSRGKDPARVIAWGMYWQ
jgi:hypothetical protein